MDNTTSELDRYLKSTPKSKALWEDAKNFLPGGDSRNSIFWAPYPIFVDSAKGCHVIDSDGTDRLDFIGTMTTLLNAPGNTHMIDLADARGVIAVILEMLRPRRSVANLWARTFISQNTCRMRIIATHK